MVNYRGLRGLTIREWMTTKPSEPYYLVTFTGAHQALYVQWPETDPWLVTGRSSSAWDTQSWCIGLNDLLFTGADAARLVAAKKEQEATRG